MADLGFKEDASAAKELGFKETLKHAPPRSMSKDDQALGLETGPQTKSVGNFVAGYPGGVQQENTGPESKRLADIDYANRAREFGGEVAGQVVGSAIIPVGEGIGAPLGRKVVSGAMEAAGKAAPKTVDFVRKAIEHSATEHGKLALARAVAEDVGATGGKALSATARGVAAAATPVLPGVGANVGERLSRPGAPVPIESVDFTQPQEGVTPATPGHQSSLHNAVDRLRAQAGNNPRAADLLARMQASKNTPTGTITQGTGVA